MKALLQRVSSASVTVVDKKISEIGEGLLILLGVVAQDIEKDIDYLVNKTAGLRIFKDANQNMNLSLQDIGGEVLVVSQFTLCADTRRGRRPSFINAAPHEMAESIYGNFCEKLQKENIPIQMGRFGAMMEVSLVNDGPITILLDSRDRK